MTVLCVLMEVLQQDVKMKNMIMCTALQSV